VRCGEGEALAPSSSSRTTWEHQHSTIITIGSTNAFKATMRPCTRPLRSCHANPMPRCHFRPFSRHSGLASHPSPSAHKWSHPPSSIPVADDEIANLASKPLHHLSLADLVKYHIILLSTIVSCWLVRPQAWASTALDRRVIFVRKLYSGSTTNSSCTPNPISSKPPLHCSIQSEYLEDLQQLSALSVDVTPLQFEDHLHPRRRDSIYMRPCRPRRDSCTYNTNSGSRIPGVQEIH